MTQVFDDSAASCHAHAAASSVVLQRVPTRVAASVRDLYWKAAATGRHYGVPAVEPYEDGRIGFGPGAVLSFETYFGAFFEGPWRRHTRLGSLALQVRVEGGALLRVFRRAGDDVALLHEAMVDDAAMVPIETLTLNFRQQGIIFFDLVVQRRPAMFHEASWIALECDAVPIGLAAVFCTFNREPEIGRVLEQLVAEPAVLTRLGQIIIVNQGTPGLIAHSRIRDAAIQLGPRLRIIEQENFGGAGGFTRGLIEAIDDPALDHVVFLDDDIMLEPDSLLRMASFLALARDDVVVGGQMLDAVQPTRLYEAGASIADRHWSFQPQHHGLDLRAFHNLSRLNEPHAVQYNGWWCFGFALKLVERFGLPMPCFIRGDDTEFGLRLYLQRITTVSVPGIAVWHEPFYLKLGSWQLYYETRNTLAMMAIHRGFSRFGVMRRMARQLVVHLLTFRYYSTALIIRGIEDYLAGPAVLAQQPSALHASLIVLRNSHPVRSVPRTVVMEDLGVVRLPSVRLGFLWALIKAIGRNWFKRTPYAAGGFDAPHRRLQAHDLSWVTVAKADCVALETWWDAEYPSLCRSRTQFRQLAPRAVHVLAALFRRGRMTKQAWRSAHRELTSQAFWRGYLGLRRSGSSLCGADLNGSDTSVLAETESR